MTGTTPVVIVWDSLVFMGGYGIFGMVAINAVRQLGAIGRIGETARVDILSPEPLSRFADVTARTAIGLALAVVVGVSARWSILPNIAAVTVIGGIGWMAFAMAVFVFPLQGIHRRLDAEKSALKAEADRRLKAILAQVHDAVDHDDLANADALNKMLTSVSHERDLVARLPTWPWSTGTLRGFVTVVVVPIAVFLLTRLLDRALG